LPNQGHKPAINWSRAVLPLRIRRRELEKANPSEAPTPPPPPERAESEATTELPQLQLGELVYLKGRKILMRASFATFDTIPRFTQLSAEHTRLFLME